MQVVQGQEARTFNTCYSTVATSILYASMFTPTIINLNDPEIKEYITNICNFYHEKSGVWINSLNDLPKVSDASEKYIMELKEFESKYNTPKAIKEFTINLGKIVN